MYYRITTEILFLNIFKYLIYINCYLYLYIYIYIYCVLSF